MFLHSKKTIFILLLHLLNSTQAIQNLPPLLRDAFNINGDSVPCKNFSTVHDFRYGLNYTHELKGMLFCNDYARRTCCDKNNFDLIKKQWIKRYMVSVDISDNCMNFFKELVCYDCDGHVGQGLKKGMCLGYCKSIYYYCRDDFFKFDDKNPNTLIFCEKNAVFCSKLRDIFEAPVEFCKSIGFEINENENLEEHLEGVITNSSYAPICYEGHASSKLFGSSKRVLGSRDDGRYEKFGAILSTAVLIFATILLLLG